jgi:hypothetical protein
MHVPMSQLVGWESCTFETSLSPTIVGEGVTVGVLVGIDVGVVVAVSVGTAAAATGVACAAALASEPTIPPNMPISTLKMSPNVRTIRDPAPCICLNSTNPYP